MSRSLANTMVPVEAVCELRAGGATTASSATTASGRTTRARDPGTARVYARRQAVRENARNAAPACARNCVAPPCAGCRTAGSVATPRSLIAFSATRPTGTIASGRTASRNSSSASPPGAALGHRRRPVAERLARGVRVRGHGVPEQHALLDPELAQQPVHDRAGHLLEPLGAEARQRVRLAPLEQRALGRERDAREAAAGVAHRLAGEHDRALTRALDEVADEVRAPDGRGAGQVELGVLVGQGAEAAAELERGHALDERPRLRLPQVRPARTRRRAGARRSARAPLARRRGAAARSGRDRR